MDYKCFKINGEQINDIVYINAVFEQYDTTLTNILIFTLDKNNKLDHDKTALKLKKLDVILQLLKYYNIKYIVENNSLIIYKNIIIDINDDTKMLCTLQLKKLVYIVDCSRNFAKILNTLLSYG